MSEREHFISTLHASFYGDKNAYDEVVRIYDELVEENKMLGKIVNKKDNIIKEVREYIKDKYAVLLADDIFLDHDEEIDRNRLLHILEILDKENKE